MVGIGNANTGNGLFTVKAIPSGAWITSYTQTAPVLPANQSGINSSDYIIAFQLRGARVQIDGSKCSLGLGRIIQDGSFPFCLAPEKYSSAIKRRVNAKWFMRDDEIWFKSLRPIGAGEEILTIYTEDHSFWSSEFSSENMGRLRQQFLREESNDISKAEQIIRNFHLQWLLLDIR